MRKTCLYCTAKHISKAIVLLSESELGYPVHKYLAIGNLSEAEDECVTDYPYIARRIRRIRLKVEEDTKNGVKLIKLLEYIVNEIKLLK